MSAHDGQIALVTGGSGLRKETDMTTNEAAMRRRARIMRAVNVPMRAVLSLPFATPLSGNLMLVSYTGRKTGKAYRQPASGCAAGIWPPARSWSPTPRRSSGCSG
jgi:hypothetical protein